VTLNEVSYRTKRAEILNLLGMLERGLEREGTR